MVDCSCTNFPASLGNVTFGASVGVGTDSPGVPLDVAGTVRYALATSGMAGLIDNDNHAIRSNGAGAQVFANNWGIPTQGWIFHDDANGVDRLTIQGNGNVGIGTSTPAYALDVNGTIRYRAAGGTIPGLVDDDNHAIRTNGAGAQVFANNWGSPTQGWIFHDGANNVDRVTIQGDGNVGIGTTSPQQALDVDGTVRCKGILLGGNLLISGAITDSFGTTTFVDQQGCRKCYYS